jgi:hypothetical protein
MLLCPDVLRANIDANANPTYQGEYFDDDEGYDDFGDDGGGDEGPYF